MIQMHLRLAGLCLLIGIFTFQGTSPAADEPAGDTEQRDARIAAELAQRSLPRLSLTAAGAPLNRPTASLLRWSNPTAGRVYGNVFLWTDGVRPVAITNIYKFFEPHTSYTFELLALDDRPIVATYEQQVLWKSTRPTTGWTVAPFDGLPAVSPAARLAQMRGIAQLVRFELIDRRNNTNGIKQELRLVDRPIYRYPPIGTTTEPRPLDGALFTSVVSNDPEAWILVETTETGYRLRCFRMNLDALRARIVSSGGSSLLAEWPVLTWNEVRANGSYSACVLKEPPAP